MGPIKQYMGWVTQALFVLHCSPNFPAHLDLGAKATFALFRCLLTKQDNKEAPSCSRVSTEAEEGSSRTSPPLFVYICGTGWAGHRLPPTPPSPQHSPPLVDFNHAFVIPTLLPLPPPHALCRVSSALAHVSGLAHGWKGYSVANPSDACRQLPSRQTTRSTPALGVAWPSLLLLVSIPRPLKPPTSFLLATHLSQPRIFFLQRGNLSAVPLRPLT